MAKENNVKLSYEELKGAIYEAVKKAAEEGMLDEAWTDYFKGASQAIGNKFKNAGKAAVGAAKNAGTKAVNAVSNAAKNVGNAVNKQVQDIKTAGEKASMQGDNERIAKQLNQWYEEGRFGNSRQAASYIKGLINAMGRNFDSTFGSQEVTA